MLSSFITYLLVCLVGMGVTHRVFHLYESAAIEKRDVFLYIFSWVLIPILTVRYSYLILMRELDSSRRWMV